MSMYQVPGQRPLGHRFRLGGWTFIALALLLLLAWLAPQQLPVILYKLALVVIGSVLAYRIDRAMFPYARPHLECPGWQQSIAMLRRAIIVVACVLGLTLGL